MAGKERDSGTDIQDDDDKQGPFSREGARQVILWGLLAVGLIGAGIFGAMMWRNSTLGGDEADSGHLIEAGDQIYAVADEEVVDVFLSYGSPRTRVFARPVKDGNWHVQVASPGEPFGVAGHEPALVNAVKQLFDFSVRRVVGNFTTFSEAETKHMGFGDIGGEGYLMIDTVTSDPTVFALGAIDRKTGEIYVIEDGQVLTFSAAPFAVLLDAAGPKNAR